MYNYVYTLVSKIYFLNYYFNYFCKVNVMIMKHSYQLPWIYLKQKLNRLGDLFSSDQYIDSSLNITHHSISVYRLITQHRLSLNIFYKNGIKCIPSGLVSRTLMVSRARNSLVSHLNGLGRDRGLMS